MSKTIIRDLDTNQVFDSLDELYISWYLEELKQNGFILNYKYEPDSFILGNDDVKSRKLEYIQLQTKVSRKESFPTLLQGHKYTPDFKILWNEVARNMFFIEHVKIDYINIPFTIYKSLNSIIEVKPNSGKHRGSKDKTNISRKWVMDKYDLYVEQIMYEVLFNTTFYPTRFITKDGRRMSSQIRHSTQNKMRTLNEYLLSRESVNKKVDKLKQKYNEQ